MMHKQRSRVYGKEFGDGAAWYRGDMIGRGNSSYVFLAIRKSNKYSTEYPALMAVKSCDMCCPRYLMNEDTAFGKLGNTCSNVIKFLGKERTVGECHMVYNLLFEYASGGSLADRIYKSGCGLPETEVRSFTRSILKGLVHIHRFGYVHCDLKPDNILLVANEGGEAGFTAKIADFGLSERVSPADYERNKRRKLDDSQQSWKGTVNYLPPEAVKYGVQEPTSDIWALGCVVLEMLTRKEAWRMDQELNDIEILDKLRTGGELPKIPSELSEEAKDFIRLCLVRDRTDRCGADVLLQHEFVSDGLEWDARSEVVEKSENNDDGHEETYVVDKSVKNDERLEDTQVLDVYGDDEEDVVEETTHYESIAGLNDDDEDTEIVDRYADDEVVGEYDDEDTGSVDAYGDDEDVAEESTHYRYVDGLNDDEEIELANAYEEDPEEEEDIAAETIHHRSIGGSDGEEDPEEEDRELKKFYRTLYGDDETDVFGEVDVEDVYDSYAAGLEDDYEDAEVEGDVEGSNERKKVVKWCIPRPCSPAQCNSRSPVLQYWSEEDDDD